MVTQEADVVRLGVVMPEGVDDLALVLMLQMVAMKKGKDGKVAATWVEEVRAKFEDVGVSNIREFIHYALVLQRRLAYAGHRMLHQTTLNMMLREVSNMYFAPDEP